MDKLTLEKRVEELGSDQAWWHEIELPHGVRTLSRTVHTENSNKRKWEKIRKFVDVQGKAVIDVGCCEGFFLLKMAESGASRSLGVEVDEKRFEKAQFVLDVLRPKGVAVKKMSIYDPRIAEIGYFDLALCLGLLHRVPDPYTAVKTICNLAESVIFEWCSLNTNMEDMRFWGGPYKADFYNSGYWLISRKCVKEILQRHGMTYFCDVEAHSSRAILFASKRQEAISFVSGHLNGVPLYKRMIYRLDRAKEVVRPAYRWMRRSQ